MSRKKPIPERVFLQWYGDQEPHDDPVDEVSWCDCIVYKHDVEYVRSDKLTAAQAEIAELRARCERVFSQWRAQSIRCGDDIIASNVLFECAHDLERELAKTAKANPGGAHE